MSSRRFSCKAPEGLCADFDVEDGIDPRLVRAAPAGKIANRKALQLCRQVEHILAAALEGELLRDLLVCSVAPAPDSSRLLATVQYQGSDAIPTPDILTALHAAHAKLRGAIAQAIHRRKTPELTFRVLRG